MISCLVALVLTGSTVVKTVNTDYNHVRLDDCNPYTMVAIPGYEQSSDIGAPSVPVRAVTIALPAGARVTGISIIEKQSIEFEGTHTLAPASPPVILSQKEIPQFERNDAVYESNDVYPDRIIDFVGTHHYAGCELCELLIYPVSYWPVSGKVMLHSSITFAISYEGGMQTTTSDPRLKNLVLNPEDIIAEPRQSTEFEYVIITNPPLDTVFERLATWKTKKGVRAVIRTVDWITNQYSGEDRAAQLRSYTQTLPDSGVQYVLLAGDPPVVPKRFAFAMDCEYGGHSRENLLPCDLYFADLQGTWNFDDDGLYGEIEDSVDLYPDLVVGRAPVSNINQAQRFVNKVLEYEKDPVTDNLTNAVLAGDVMWDDPYTDGGVHKDMIEDESFPAEYTITKLYHSQGTLTPHALLSSLHQGQALINHDGHGWINVMSAGTGYLENEDFDTLTNVEKYGIWVSCGCWTTAFDYDCIAEHWVNSPQGGGIAFVGNSSYGWGSPGNPGYGISDFFDSRFFYALLQQECYRLGDVLSSAKAYFIPYSRERNVYRWHQYQLNLLGDPEMPVWTQTPESLEVSYPQSVPIGTSHTLIRVMSKTTQEPVPHALVCLMKNDETYAAAHTDYGGTAFLEVHPTTLGDCDLTVTAHNYLPSEHTIPVVMGPYISFCGWTIDDAAGNGDGIANPDELIDLDVVITNAGTQTAHACELRLRSADACVVVQDSIFALDSLGISDSLFIDNCFQVMVGAAQNGHSICFELEVNDTSRTLTFSPTLLVGTPVLSVSDFCVLAPPSMPGETDSLSVYIENSGFGCGHGLIAQLSTSDPYITVLTDSVACGDLYPDSIAAAEYFAVEIDAGCPAAHTADLVVSLTTQDYAFQDTFVLLIGESGFHDDMESGGGLWTTGGTDNLWHISTTRSFSPTQSWYCGDSITGEYHPNMDCYIQSIPFMVHERSLLSFCRWFHVPVYGTDGLYVIVMRNGQYDTLDFIGTGGALGRDLESSWFEEKYDLDAYASGDTIQVRLSFISDDEFGVGEGFYVDDISVEHVFGVDEFDSSIVACAWLELKPNPFTNDLTVSYMPSADVVHTEACCFRIYDASGRCVRAYDMPAPDVKQPLILQWDGTDDQHRALPAGVYFIRVTAAQESVTQKVVFVR